MRLFKLLTIFLFLLSTQSFAADKIFNSGGTAINGIDTVAYHTQGKPVKGDPNYSHVWNNTNWIFTSLENRAAFAKNPEKYAPQYGGYCAYAVSKGSLNVPTVPEAWSIHEGNLYLNYSRQVQAIWKKDKQAYIKQADRKWN